MDKKKITKYFKNLSHTSIDFEGWLSENNKDETVFERLGKITTEPLSKVQLNQLLHLSFTGGITDGFFKYYWLKSPEHTYEVKKISDGKNSSAFFKEEFFQDMNISSLEHLKWGIYRIYIDCLLYFGNINYGFNCLRTKTFEELKTFFESKKMPALGILKNRGESIEFNEIESNDRWLISEVACKNFETEESSGKIAKIFFEQYLDCVKNWKVKAKL